MSMQKKIIGLVKAVSGQANILTIPRMYIDLLGGDMETALMLSQIIYWSDRGGKGDGWFYKKYEEWKEELGLSKYQSMKAIERLEGLKIITTKVKKADGVPTKHFFLNEDVLEKLIIEFFDNQKNGKSKNSTLESKENELSESQNTELSLTETTTETTPETTNTRVEKNENDLPLEWQESKEDEKEEENILDWFAARETPQPEHIPLTAEGFKKRVGAALEEGIKKQIGLGENGVKVHDFCNGLPERIRSLALAFCTEFGRPPLSREKSGWMMSWNEQADLGLSPTNIEQAMRYMNENGLTITWPGSVTGIAEKHKKFGTLSSKGNGRTSEDIFKDWKASNATQPTLIDL